MKASRILLVLVFTVGLLGAVFNGAIIYTRFFLISASIAVLSWVWTQWSAVGLSLVRGSRVLRANVGDVFEENYELGNNSRVPAAWMEILNRSTLPHAAGSRLFTFVLGRQKRSYLARTWLTRRGGFQLGPTKISTGDPFGLFSASKTIAPQKTLIVFPVIHDIQSFPYPPGMLPGGQVIRRKSHDITPHAAGVREYVHGDAMKRIHWPTTARRGQLMVKEFEQDPQAEIWLYLDPLRKTFSAGGTSAGLDDVRKTTQVQTAAFHTRIFRQHCGFAGTLFHWPEPLPWLCQRGADFHCPSRRKK